jgi:uncharacterized protein (TIGR02594 family)
MVFSCPKEDCPVREQGPKSWLNTASKYLGMKEIVGPKHNPDVVKLWELGKAGNFDTDETPWCAAFVSAVLEESGIRSARTGWSRSYLNWGKKLRGPAYGCIVVFKRGSGGHVGFVVGRTSSGHLAVLGGNQGNAVNIKAFKRSRVLGYRWPDGRPDPAGTGFSSLPKVRTGIKLSLNEA